MKLLITLKSDLCAATGDGFSSVIDTDIAYDKYGLPEIPGRRLKGCLKETADIFTDKSIVNAIFGVSGTSEGCLSVSNAHIKGYSDTVEFLKNKGENPQKILSFFTYTRAQIKINDEGFAKDGSLRFTRVVGHYINNEEMQFEADIKIADEYKEIFGKICRALKNIGYNRNRGLGAVKCELITEDTDNVDRYIYFEDENEYALNYTVFLETPVMVPSNGSMTSCEYIPGTSVMGYFAGKLWNKLGDKEAENVFLKNNVIFSNLYPVSKSGKKCIPAPKIIAKDKRAADEGSKYVSLLDDSIEKFGKKPLKGGFTDEGFIPVEIEKEIIYHHINKTDGNKVDLYTQECISAGQTFYGSITGKGRFLKEIADIMKSGSISVGRSKTAQYSVCKIVSVNANIKTSETLSVKKGELLVYIAESDLAIATENGSYVVTFDYIEKALALKLDKTKSVISYITLSGYNSKWNHKKPHIRAISKGSCFAFTAEKEAYEKVLYIGEKTEEGFGKLTLYKASEINPVPKAEITIASQTQKTNCVIAKLLADSDIKEKVRMNAIKYAFDNEAKLCSLTASFIGRLTNMVKQADDYYDLRNRFNSVKNKAKKEAATDMLKSYNGDNWREYYTVVLTLGKYFIKQKGDMDND